MLGVPLLRRADVVAEGDACRAMFDPGAGGAGPARPKQVRREESLCRGGRANEQAAVQSCAFVAGILAFDQRQLTERVVDVTQLER